ncbi:MAG: aldolase/citrate lyase family protein [Pseudonocardiales bacterium]
MQQTPSDTTSLAIPSLASAGLGRGIWLVTPGGCPGRFATAADSGADVALLDLEDSVPQPRKDEAPRAIQNLTGILRAPGLAGVVFGAADYAAEAGCKITSRAVWYPRVMLAAAAATVGLPAVDSPYFSLHDPDGLRREAEEAAELGFIGKIAIHPVGHGVGVELVDRDQAIRARSSLGWSAVGRTDRLSGDDQPAVVDPPGDPLDSLIGLQSLRDVDQGDAGPLVGLAEHDRLYERAGAGRFAHRGDVDALAAVVRGQGVEEGGLAGGVGAVDGEDYAVADGQRGPFTAG